MFCTLLLSTSNLSSPQICANMGIVASTVMGKGKPTTQMVNAITGTLYNSFIDKETNNFPEFHVAFLDIFNTFNSALPGKHYDVPSHPEVKACFEAWNNAKNEDEKRETFVKLINDKVSLNKAESATLITGLVTPPAAMVAKKAGERVPALKMTKAVPDVLFVPSITFLALISVKVSKNVIRQRMVHRDEQIANQKTEGEEQQKAKEKPQAEEQQKAEEKPEAMTKEKPEAEGQQKGKGKSQAEGQQKA